MTHQLTKDNNLRSCKGLHKKQYCYKTNNKNKTRCQCNKNLESSILRLVFDIAEATDADCDFFSRLKLDRDIRDRQEGLGLVTGLK